MSGFLVHQSLSINQRRNARLNEYFAVVGLPDGPLLLSDPPPNTNASSSSSDGVSSPGKAKEKEKEKDPSATMIDSRSHGGGGDGVRGGRGLGDGIVNSDGSGGGREGSTAAAPGIFVVDGGNLDNSNIDINININKGNINTDTDTDKTNNINTASTVGLNSNSSSSSHRTAGSVAGVDEALTPPPCSSPLPGGEDGSGDTPSPPPFLRPLRRRLSYGSCELGKIRAKAATAGINGPLHARFRSRVLHRYPLYDHKGDGCAFPANLTLFCLPGGLKLSLEMALPTFFSFVHTRANGQHMFGYCLCLHEPLEKRHRSELQKLVDAHNNAAPSAEGNDWMKMAGDLATLALDPQREVYAPKCLCLLSTWPYFGPFREWLLNLYRISLSPFQIPLERYIGNFLLEVPIPSPGRIEVLYNMGNTTITFACPPHNKPVAWGSVPFEPLFECLSHENILTLFTCLLRERSVLLKSSQLSLLTSCAEVLTLLLYPFTWSHVYIPVLPEALLGVLAAPMPFLIGVHRTFVEDTGMDVAHSVVQVDLDNDVVEMGSGSSATFPELPSKRRSKLLSKLGEHAQLGHCRTPEYRQAVTQKSDLAFSMAVRPCDFDDDELDTPPPDWDAVREAFLRFFVTILSGYRRCLVYPTKANPNPARLFNVEDFVDKLERDSRPFAEAICDTQAFQNFIDARIQPEADDLDVVFFDACIAAKRNRSMLTVSKNSDANFLRPETFVKAKTVFALTPDTTGLDMTAPPRSHERFPSLSAALYPIPRDIPSLSNPTNHAHAHAHASTPGGGGGGAPKSRARLSGGSGGGSNGHGNGGGSGHSAFHRYFGISRKGDGGGDGDDNAGRGDGDEEGGGRRSFSSFGGGRGVFARGTSSRGGDDDWNPLSAEATVFAVFIVGFCATIGVDTPPPRSKIPRSNSGFDTPKSSSSAGPPPSAPVSTTKTATAKAAAPAAEKEAVTSTPQVEAESASTATTPSPVAAEDTRVFTRVSGAVEKSSSAGGVARDGIGTSAVQVVQVQLHHADSDSQGGSGLSLASSSSWGGGSGSGRATPPAAAAAVIAPSRGTSDRGGRDGGDGAREDAVKRALKEEPGEATSSVGGVKIRKSSRMAFSELKHDVREERLYRANAALRLAFEALGAMREKAPAGEETVYRSLISACGRSGNSEKAMAVVEMMMSTGIVPDAMVSRCLVDAFAMDDSFSDGGAHPLSLLDWSKLQPKRRDGRRSHDSSGGRGDTPFFKKMMKRFNEKADGINASTPIQTPTAARKLPVAATAAAEEEDEDLPPTTSASTLFRAKSTAGSIVVTPMSTPDRRSPALALPDLATSGTGVGEGQPDFPFGAPEARESFNADFESPVQSDSWRGRWSPTAESSVTFLPSMGQDQEARRSSNLRTRLERSASPYAGRRGMSPEMQQEVLLGERMLESLFPDLKVDNRSETCPSCHAELSSEQVRAGWSSDPNDYTTECRAVVDLEAAAVAAAAAGASGTGWGGGSGGAARDTASADASAGDSGSRPGSGGPARAGGTGASAILPAGRGGGSSGGMGMGVGGRWKTSSSMGSSGSKASKGSSLGSCGRRFVARFSVHSTAVGWEGTTGPGTPLWCEYLPPWVLRKEFHTILVAYGVQYLCSERFRQGLGPAEDSFDPTGGGGGGTPSMGGEGGCDTMGRGSVAPSRAVDRTVFWNLVVHFREHCLPITFLLADASAAAGPLFSGGSSALYAAE